MARNQLYIRQGDTELRANTPSEIEKLANILKDKDLPRKHDVKWGKIGSSGYGDNSEKSAWRFVLFGAATIGIGLLGRKLYRWLLKKNSPVQSLPPSFPMPTDGMLYEPTAGLQQEDSPEPSEPKTWSDQFLEEYGPMPELPPVLQFVVERSPDGYEVAMAVMLLCAFAALCFSKVRAKYLDGKVHAPNLQVIIEGNWGTGKEKFMTALNTLFKRLFDRDKMKFLSHKEGQIIQWAGISATESKFIDIMANNGEVYVLMVSSEILAAVNNMRKQNGLTAEYYRKAFDNGEVYRGNKSKDAQGIFRVFMNYIMTGTPGDTAKFISKELEGGTASRICWIRIPDSGRYLESLDIEDSAELERIRDCIDALNKTFCYDYDGSMDCDIPAEEHFFELGYVNAAIKDWIVNDQWHRANENPNDPRIGARGRMGAIAFHLAMVIHMLFGCPGTEMAQTRRKVLDLTIYLANYCMERFLHKFGGIQRVQRELNNQAERVEINSAESQATQQSSSEPDEENYSGGLSKSTVRKMYEMYKPGIVGYGTVAKRFNLHGENGLQKVKRAIQKYKRELEQKQRQ